MSDKCRREILLSELSLIRIVCKNRIGNKADETQECGAIIEIPLERLVGVKKCPLCENNLRPTVDINVEKEPFPQFVTALKRLQSLGSVEISFVLASEQ